MQSTALEGITFRFTQFPVVRSALAAAIGALAIGCSQSSSGADGTDAGSQGGGSVADAADAGASNPAPPTDAGAAVAPDAQPVVLTGTPIVATAVLGTGEPLLGTTVDALFNQVSGSTILKPRTDASGNPTHTTVNQVTTGWTQIESTKQLAANLAGWGLVSASLDASNATRFMSMRAYRIDYYEDVDLAIPTGPAPSMAVYFVSKIYFGHSYEALFSGDQSTFSAAIAASLPKASGSIQAEATRSGLTVSNVGRGLVPNGGDAIFAVSQEDVMSHYSATGPAVPIYVEYRLVPGASEPAGSTVAWASPTIATIAIDEIDIFHNGSLLDASNTAWSVTADCTVNGALVDTNDLVWSSSSVSAGGTSVSPDGTGPQDPNTGSPSATYGRHAGLPWSKSFPVTDGNTLECALSGQRTDVSAPVSLPVTLQLAVDSATDVDARAGNYDTASGLDYQVHYTVTYTTR